MIPPLIVPRKARKYILFQRTEYIKLTKSTLGRSLRRITPFLSYEHLIRVEAMLRGAAIQTAYSRDMFNEYQSMKEYLPPECESILDIGCGIAGVDIFLYHHFSNLRMIVHLLDRTQVESKIFYMYGNQGAFYNSLLLASETLIANNIPRQNIRLLEATDSYDIPVSGSIDLIISLISWGFHYPVETYLEQAGTVLRPGGRMILDVRKGTGGLDLLSQTFSSCSIILEKSKFHRVCVIK